MRGYKGMNDDMTCRGFHYQVGKTYETDKPIALCVNGFHFCKTLADVFNYYNRVDGNRFFEVEASDVIEDDDKCVCAQITIVRELSTIEVNRITYSFCDGNGDGYGNGDGDGYGNGNGNGYGYGNGDGDGNGNGDGYGNGDGNDNGIGTGDNILKILNYMEELKNE